MKRLKFIAIAGNIGAGKTELTHFLSKKFGLTPFFEPNAENPYLEAFYADMRRWSFHSQVFFLSAKFQLHRELERKNGKVLQDRTLYEDAEIFAKNLYRQKLMSERDFETYWRLYQTVVDAVTPPDLMIYLRCPVKTLKQRIRLRGREMERDIPTTYLSRLNRLYEDWFKNYRLSPVITLNTDKLDYLTDLVHRVDLFKTIETHL